MKKTHLILLSFILIFLLAACERPAPTGDIPAPADDSVIEIIPRPDDTEAIQPTDELPTTAPETTTEDGSTEPVTDGETAVTPTESTDSTSPPLEEGTYVVRAGDTLGNIAFIYNITVEDIMAANNITNPHVLAIGQELIIPGAGFAQTPTASSGSDSSTEGQTPAPTSQEQIHIVQAGDTLYRIGLRYGFTIDELAQYNSLTDLNNLKVGQEIRIPPK